ncbi:hypothetical protein A4U49_13125 [Acidithiobacillus ferrivorans]|uniref:hypothetical protein n=1 Tax=Acidithiobacillus ferrivorans TaxID=160808 RepID=UPI000894032E|nr:hypothetical protein [Acidithiobacillus ferrivorans]OFA15390.1 hypothetical protein A4U49_13125 [Acidithiobacillus ferrivorans]
MAEGIGTIVSRSGKTYPILDIENISTGAITLANEHFGGITYSNIRNAVKSGYHLRNVADDRLHVLWTQATKVLGVMAVESASETVPQPALKPQLEPQPAPAPLPDITLPGCNPMPGCSPMAENKPAKNPQTPESQESGTVDYIGGLNFLTLT